MEEFYHSSKKRVGYWITERKYKRLNFSLFELLCISKNIQLIKLNLDEDLEHQGPFHLILHKVSDLVSNISDARTTKRLETFQEYVLRHPEVKVIDPLDRMVSLLNRKLQYQFAQQCNLLDGGEEFFVPSFVELTSKDLGLNKELVARNNISFPVVCKSSVSTHPGKTQTLDKNAHNPDDMMILFDERDLKDVEPPCVVQSFINHNARLYKVFVVGDRHFTIERPSIKNFYRKKKMETIFFKSSDISKSNSSSILNKLDEDDAQKDLMIEVEGSKVDRLVRSLRSKFRLDLFGVDVIIENGTGRYGVIDLNPFPGYDGVRDFLPCLLELMERRMDGEGGERGGGEPMDSFTSNHDDCRHNSPYSSDSAPSLSSSSPSSLSSSPSSSGVSSPQSPSSHSSSLSADSCL